MLNSVDRFTPVQLSNVILAFARLNFQPANGEAFYSLVILSFILQGNLSLLSSVLVGSVDTVSNYYLSCSVNSSENARTNCIPFPFFMGATAVVPDSKKECPLGPKHQGRLQPLPMEIPCPLPAFPT